MLSEHNGSLRIEGPMTISQATELLQQGLPMITSADRSLNFEAVTTVDSSALAVVLEFLRAARQGGRKLQLHNLPSTFSSLATLYGVDGLFIDSSIK